VQGLVFYSNGSGTMEQVLINDGSIDPGLGLGEVFETSLEWMRLREVNPFKGNLLKNPCFTGSTHPWEIIYRGDYILESTGQGGCKPFPEEAGCDANTRAVVTSYTWFKREQSIPLSKVPKMKRLFELYDVYAVWSVWIAPRFDCSSEYKAYINSELLSEVSLPAGREWQYHTESVKVDNMKELKYSEQGKDRQFWAGHYGVKILNPTVRLRLQKKVKYTSYVSGKAVYV